MKKLRVFQTVKKRRIVSGFSIRNLGTVLLLLLIIPYLITFLFGNLREGSVEQTAAAGASSEEAESDIYVSNITVLGNEKIPLEVYVADKLARSIDSDFEIETLKAQAVLIRSSLLASEENWKSSKRICVEDKEYGSSPISENMWQAVSDTSGVCLLWEDKPTSGAYFAVSNGATRNGEELSLTEYPYLKSVDCSRDFLSEDFISSERYEEGEFERIWQQIPGLSLSDEEIQKKEKLVSETALNEFHIYRDSTGYVLYIEANGKCVSGEQFRNAFLLSSASFQMEKEETQIVFTVKGAGHGLGMSQFAANEMAREEEDYVEILKYFFRDVTITKIE